MDRMRKGLAIVLFAFIALTSTILHAQQPEDADKTLSPYFFVRSDDPAVDQLPLKSTKAEVRIAGVIADVVVTQVYQNEGKKPLEALYVFPASTRAAVYGMKMTLGERTIVATIQEREEARRTYETAKQEGKTASLLEQQRPNVFQMNVANILPGDVIQVELKYTEMLVPSEGIYEFVYPTVVGPRYSNQAVQGSSPSERWVENPYFRQGKKPAYAFDIRLQLAAGLPIQEMACSSHKVRIRYDGPSRSSVDLDPSETSAGNRDFILRYQLAGKKVESGLLLFEGEQEKFFLLMLQPPKRVTASQIPPREYIFIVDVSGSMYGFPLDMSKKLLRDLIGGLRPTDHFNVLLFSGGNSVLAEKSLQANPENIRKAVDLIDRQKGGGGTELLPAMKRALSLPKTEGVSRTLVIATDGYVTVEEEVFDLMRNHLGDANMFTFGIGTAVNRHLLEGMARVGMGEPFILTRPEEIHEKTDRFRKMIQSPVLTHVTLDFGRFNPYDVEPSNIPDVFAERPILVFGKWRGNPEGEITLRGISGTHPFTGRIDPFKEKASLSNSALRYLWARHRIALLSDYNSLRRHPERVKEVTRLGIEYNLLTAYTSFVAVDQQVRNKNGQAVTVKQPLPLPQGVSDYAVGKGETMARAASAPPPSHGSRLDWLPGRFGSPNVMKEQDKIEEKKQEASARRGGLVEIRKISGVDETWKLLFQNELKSQLSAVKDCYRKVLETQPGLQGEITLELVVDSNGKVKKVRLTSPSLKGKGLESCLIEAFRVMAFSAPSGKKETVVTLSIRFHQPKPSLS